MLPHPSAGLMAQNSKHWSWNEPWNLQLRTAHRVGVMGQRDGASRIGEALQKRRRLNAHTRSLALWSSHFPSNIQNGAPPLGFDASTCWHFGSFQIWLRLWPIHHQLLRTSDLSLLDPCLKSADFRGFLSDFIWSSTMLALISCYKAIE